MQTNKGDALVILSGLAGVFLAFFVLASMLPPAGMALVLVLILVFGLLMAIPGWVLVSRLTSPRRDIAPDPRASIYAPAADYASPKPPQVIDVMRFDDNGQTRPYALAPPKPAPVQLRTRTAEGEHAQASAAHLLRFAGLRTPSRSEWSGKREAYGECATWFTAQRSSPSTHSSQPVPALCGPKFSRREPWLPPATMQPARPIAMRC